MPVWQVVVPDPRSSSCSQGFAMRSTDASSMSSAAVCISSSTTAGSTWWKCHDASTSLVARSRLQAVLPSASPQRSFVRELERLGAERLQ